MLTGLELMGVVAFVGMALALACAAALHHVSHREPGDATLATPDAAPPPNPSLDETATDPAQPGARPHAAAYDLGTGQPGPPAAVEAAPAGTAAEEKGAAVAPGFSFSGFCRAVLRSDDVASSLADIVADIRAREDDAAGTAPSPMERFLARQLEEAGLEALTGPEVGRHTISAVLLTRTGRFYLRAPRSSLPYRVHLAIIGVEAALNMLCAANAYFDDLSSVDERHLYRLASQVQGSVCAQADNVDTADWTYLAMPWQAPFQPSDNGEWSLRYRLAESLETLQLPYRLQARFRGNVAGGDVAIEFSMTPAEAFPRSAYVGELGIVPTTTHMRQRAASDYAARVALLLAGLAFNASRRLRRVWVAAVLETPRTRSCHLSACIERRSMARIDLTSVRDPIATLKRVGASLEEEAGVLKASDQCFYLEDERFCPPMRHDLWSMSERSLPASAAISLGARRVSDLLIHEELPRVLAAERIAASLVSDGDAQATQRNVGAVLDAAGATSDISVWDGAERVARMLVEGSLSADDPETLRDAFVRGDGLSAQVDRAQELIARRRPDMARKVLAAAVRPIDAAGAYRDTQAVAYRCFDSFVERVVYNRLNKEDGRSVVLVPDAYLLAELMLSALLLALPAEEGGDPDKAVSHARRALEVAPLNPSANIGMAACLEAAGDLQGAARQICDYLSCAHRPQDIAFAYFRLASVMESLGEHDARKACHQLCLHVMPQMTPFVLAHYQGASAQDASLMAPLDRDALIRAMEDAHIPLAPSPQIAYILYDGASASIDAEVFPVARDIMHAIETLTGDDVIHAVRSSLEREPDV